jgi:DnaJ-related protein SCJ1
MEGKMEKDFWATWEKYRQKGGKTLDRELGKKEGGIQMPKEEGHDEL